MFELNVQNSKFENESQLVTGSVAGSVFLAQLAVSKCQGPLFVLKLSGVFNLTSSNFTSIETGPLVAVTGAGASVSLVWLARLYVAHISNFDPVLYGNLLNAKYSAVWLDSVRMENFTSSTNGVFFLIQSVLLSRYFSAQNASASSNIVGISFYSVLSLNDTSMDAVYSGGTMWNFFHCTVTLRRISYRRVTGYLTASRVYTTNLFIFRTDSDTMIDELDITTVNPGTPLIFVFNSSLLLTNSVVRGPVGMSAFSTNGGVLRIRQVSLHISTATSVIHSLAGSVIDIDQFSLRSVAVSLSIFSLSSEAVVHIGKLELTNVTSPSLASGLVFTVTIKDTRIEDSRIGTLLNSGMKV